MADGQDEPGAGGPGSSPRREELLGAALGREPGAELSPAERAELEALLRDPAARRELDGPVRLLFVGRLSPRKGPQVALATLQELLGRGIDARLGLLGSVFEGYEWFEAELQATVAEQGLADRVEFLGFRADIWPYLADADVVLVPSVRE